MTRFLFPALGLPLLLASGPAPADNPPATTQLPTVELQFVPAQPADAPYTVVPPRVLLQPAPGAPQHELPMVIVQVDPSKYPMVIAQGKPGHYPMTVVPMPGGRMDAPQTTIPYQVPQLALPSTAKPLKLLITPPKPAK